MIHEKIGSLYRKGAHKLFGRYKHRAEAVKLGYLFTGDFTGEPVYMWLVPRRHVVFMGTDRWGPWYRSPGHPIEIVAAIETHGVLADDVGIVEIEPDD